MTDSKLIDSSIWIAYLFEGSHKGLIETAKINFISALSLFEIKSKLLKKGIAKEIISKNLKFIKAKTITIPIDEELAENAAEISIKHSLHMVDSIIYASAIKNKIELITLDNDFRNIPDVKILSL